MKLPISLLVLVALGQATTTPESTVTNSTPANTSETSPKDDNQTSKRELDEGNFGDRNKELLSKDEATGSSPKIVQERELNELVTDEPPVVPHQQLFGVRLPPMTKISDVLSEHGPSFEAAVAKHLYSPISVYQTKISSPAGLKVAVPAASQSVFMKQKKVPSKVELPLPHTPDFSRNRLNLLVDSFPKRVDSGLSRQQANLPQEIFRPQQIPKKPMASLFPIYDQLGPYRYQGEVVPSQYLHERGLYQIVPVRTGFDYGDQEGNRDNNYPNHGNHEAFKSEPTEIPRLQIDIPSNQGYHSHPNGAISFASFSNKLPFNTQYNTAPQPQPKSFHQSQQLNPQIQSDVMLQAQEQKLAPVKPMVYRLIQELEKYEPVYQQAPQLIPFKQQIESQPRTLNALQQHLLFQVPQPFSNPQVIQLQQLPAFSPLPESLLAPELLQQKNRLAISERSPRPFSYKDQSTPTPRNLNIPIESASTQHPLPSLKPDYSNYGELLKPQSHSTPVFLPTPQQLIPTSTPKVQPVPDQLISSTTIQPTVKNHEEPKEQMTPKETQPQPRPYLPLVPQVIHHSQPTVLSPLIQTTTYLPFVSQKPQSKYVPYTSPQPGYQPTTHHQSIKPLPRHDVVIQRQEIKELILEPDYKIRYQQREIGPQQEREAYQIRSQDQQQLFEQLQPLQFHQELQELNSEQYQLEIRQSSNQQHSHPLQPQLSQQQHQGPQQAQQQQQGPEHAQQQHKQGSEQAQQQQPGSEQAHQQQPGSEQAQQQQQELIQAQQQQHEPEQAQQQQQGSEQTEQQQQHGSEQTQQQQQDSNHAQYLRHHVESDINYQTSPLNSSQEPEEHNEAEKNQQQIEPQPQQQQPTTIQTTTEKHTAQIINLLQTPSNEERPYLDSIVTPIQPSQPQTYNHPHYVAAYTEYSPLAAGPSYSDVQYFGKFAESLLGNRHH